MRILTLITSFFAAAVVIASPAMGQCVSVDPAIVPDIRVDPLDATGSAQAMQPLTLTFRRVGTGTSPIRVVYQIEDEDSPVQSRIGITAGPQIAWHSVDSGRDISALRSESDPSLHSGTIVLDADDSAKQASLRLVLTNLREDLAAGVYREQFTVRFWCADTGPAVPYEIPGIVTATVLVPNVLSANIAGASARGEIDFLAFATLSRSLAISIRSTGRYEVTARSVNGSVMLREGSVSRRNAETISYNIRFGGQPLIPGSGAGVTNARAGLAGVQIPLEVVVEDVSAKRAGTYSDTLILTLAPVT